MEKELTKISDNNIFPVFDKILGRADKECLLKQKARVVWIFGLSGSGKSTIAALLEKQLYHLGFLTQVLDGDNVRTGINNNLGFSEEDRYENIRRIAEISKLFVDSGVIVIGCFISPTKQIREKAKQIIGENDFLEVFVDTPIEICEQRDVKGLYKKAREGKIKNLSGLDAPFEKPDKPFYVIKYDGKPCESEVEELIERIKPLIEIK